MKCPVCGKEMSEGFIKNPRGVIAWTPKEKKTNILQSKVKDYQIKLGISEGMGVTIVDTNYCEDCGMFIIQK